MNNTNDKPYSHLITPPATTTVPDLANKLNESVSKYAQQTNSYNLSHPDIVKMSQELDKELIELIKF